MKTLSYKIYILLFLPFIAFSQNELEIGREFGLFTSKNLTNYIKPLLTTVNQSLNSSLITNSDISNEWSIGLDISISGMAILQNQKSFAAELPKLFGDTSIVLTAQSANGKMYKNSSGNIFEPTIYGGKSTPVFASPQNAFPPDSFYKSVAFAEGVDISYMSGLPVLQLVLGFPTRTELRTRFISIPLLNLPLIYYTLGINQNISHYYDPFELDSNYSYSIFGAYHSIAREKGIDIKSIAFGTAFSGKFSEKIYYTFSIQYENMWGGITAIRNTEGNNDIVNNPYEEVRDGKPLDVGISTFTKLRLQAGIDYQWKFLKFHADLALASQPMISTGISFILFQIEPNDEVELESEPIHVPDIKETQPVIVELKKNEQEIQVQELNKINIPFSNNLLVLDENEDTIKVITVENVVSKELHPFLPYIFFDEDMEEISSRYSLINSTEAAEFNILQLKHKGSLEIYHSCLNILGKRMQEYPSSMIALIGCNSDINNEKGNLQLSKNRAEKIKNYLINTWSIAPSRIITIARNLPEKYSKKEQMEGQADNRRVEIRTEQIELLAPILIEDTLRSIHPEGIILRNNITSESDLKDWNLQINVGKNKIIDKIGNGVPDNDMNLDFKSSAFSVNDSSITKINLQIKNSTNQELNTKKEIPIKVVNNQKTINTYNLILFDYNSSSLSKENKAIVSLVNTEIGANSKIKVIGFSDLMGDAEYNRKLSLDRAKAVAKGMLFEDIEVIGMGEENSLFDNSLPEGRFYSRTVQIQVSQINTPGENNAK